MFLCNVDSLYGTFYIPLYLHGLGLHDVYCWLNRHLVCCHRCCSSLGQSMGSMFSDFTVLAFGWAPTADVYLMWGCNEVLEDMRNCIEQILSVFYCLLEQVCFAHCPGLSIIPLATDGQIWSNDCNRDPFKLHSVDIEIGTCSKYALLVLVKLMLLLFRVISLVSFPAARHNLCEILL